MILCKIITLPDSTTIALVPEGRHFASFDALERAIEKNPEAFEPDTQYTPITVSKVITTKPQTRVQFDTTITAFPLAEEPKPKADAKPPADDGKGTKPAGKPKAEPAKA